MSRHFLLLLGLITELLLAQGTRRILAFFSENTPKSIEESIETAMDQTVDARWQLTLTMRYFRDFEGFQDNEEAVDIVVDATFSERAFVELAQSCHETGIPILVLASIKTSKWNHSAFYVEGSQRQIITAMKSVKSHFRFETVNVLCDLSDFAITFDSSLLEEEKLQFDVQIISNESETSAVIGRVIRPKGHRVTLFATEALLSRRIIDAQKSMHIGGVGYANILPLRSVLWNAERRIDECELNGNLVVVPYGMEHVQTETEYFSYILGNIFRIAVNSNSTSSLISNLESEYPNHIRQAIFSVVNICEGKRVVVGTVIDEVCNITAPITFLGNSSAIPSNSTAAIQISGNFGNLNPTDSFIPLYLYFWGSTQALNDINQQGNILQGFNLELWNFTAGYFTLDPDFVLRNVLTHKDKLGAAMIESITAPHALAFTAFLRSRNITIPMIGATITHPVLSSKKNFPYFLRTCLSDEYMNVATVQIIDRLGWTRFGVLAVNATLDKSLLEDFRRLCSSSSLSIANSPEHQILNYASSLDEAREKYTASLKHFIETRARVLFIMSPQLAVFIPELLYDLGLRRGDVVVVTRGWLMSDVLSYLESDSPYKTVEIMTGALEFSPDRFVGALGSQIAQDYKSAFGVDASTFACSYYDSTFTIAYALDWLIESGQDYMNAEILMNALRSTRFKGCTGLVTFDPNSNDRTPMRYLIESLTFVDGNSIVKRVGSYDPQGMTLLSLSEDFVWADGSKQPPTDTRTSSFGCPFEDRLITDFPDGQYLLYGVGTGIVLLTLSVAVLYWRYGRKTEFVELTSRKEIEIDDVIVMAGVLVETLQALSLSTSENIRVPDIVKVVSLSTWDVTLASGRYEKLLIITESFIVFWLTVKVGRLLWDCNSQSYYVKLSEKLSHLVESWLFVPILSVLLKSFVCIHGIANYDEPIVFDHSYLEADCSLICWSNWHLAYSIPAILSLLVFIPGAVIFNPLWQEVHANLNIKTSHKFILIKSVFQAVLVVVREVLKETYPLAHAVLFFSIVVVYLIISVCVPCYNYKRTQLWHLVGICIVLWSTFLSIFHLAFSESEHNSLFTGLLAGGWGSIILISIVYQWLKLPSQLYRLKGIDTLYLFKFAFQRVDMSIVNHLEVEFQRTGHSRRVSLRMPRGDFFAEAGSQETGIQLKTRSASVLISSY